MMVLPAIADKMMPAKGLTQTYFRQKDRFIPNTKYAEFWQALYSILIASGNFTEPVRACLQKVNPYFGYFGERIHPETFSQNSFHTGVDIEGRRKTQVTACADGILEYSGYGIINGKYFMMSHPEIRTEDDFVLYSLYMHLHDFTASFSSYQKMLRQISLNAYPIIPITKGQVIGSIGKTGESSYPNQYTHLHFQVEFRHKDGRVVLLDPLRLLQHVPYANITAGLSLKEFDHLFDHYKNDLVKRKLHTIWEKDKKREK